MFSMMGTSQSAPVVEAAPAAQILSAIDLENLVDRILASSPGELESEVRIILKNHVLDGTEILLQRNSDGMLSIHFLSTNAAAFQTLAASQADLKSLLERYESQEVKISMELDNRQGENDSNQRSRGYIDFFDVEA